MAFVRKEQKELDGLGPCGIIREALKLLTTYSKFFVLIQLTLLLPPAALAVTCEYCFYWALYKDANLPPDWHCRHFHAVDFTVFLRNGAFGFDLGITWGVQLLVMAGSAVTLTPVLSIPSSAIIYSVGLHFKGQRVSYWDARTNCLHTPLMRASDLDRDVQDISLILHAHSGISEHYPVGRNPSTDIDSLDCAVCCVGTG